MNDNKFLDKIKDRLDDEWSEVVDAVEERREAVELLKKCRKVARHLISEGLSDELNAFLDRVK